MTEGATPARPSLAGEGPGPGERDGAPRAGLLAALAPVLLVAVLLALWEGYVELGSTSSFLLPAPHAVAAR